MCFPLSGVISFLFFTWRGEGRGNESAKEDTDVDADVGSCKTQLYHLLSSHNYLVN